MVVTETRLIHLVSVVRHGHFGLAAASLGISQPALSKSIQGLETALGAKLLDRQHDRVVPTTYGDIVLQHGTKILNSQQEMLRNLKSLDDLDDGQISVLFGPFPGVISGYPAACRLLAKHPKIQLKMGVRDWREVMDAVIEGRVDFGLAEQNKFETDKRFAFEVVGTHLGRLVCDPEHPVLRQPSITLSDTLQYPWVSTRLPSRLVTAFPLQPCPAGRIDPLNGDFVPSVQIDQFNNLSGFAKGTDMLVLTPLALVEQELLAGIIAPLPGMTFRARYGLLRLKSHSLSPAALAYIAEIRAVEAEFGQREEELAAIYC